MYNSFEERALIQGVSRPQGPGRRRRRRLGDSRAHAAVAVPEEVQHPAAVRDLHRPHRREQGLHRAVRVFRALRGDVPARPRSGADRIEACSTIPKHPRIRHLGFLSDEDKFDALAAADVLIMPSRFESLSMVALEAWALGKPVLANGRCDVLRGQCVRSNGGLYYENFEEFAEALYALEGDRPARRDARPQRPRVLPAPLHVAGDRAEVPRDVRSAEARAGAARWSRCPASSRAGAGRCRPARDVVDGAPPGPVLR